MKFLNEILVNQNPYEGDLLNNRKAYGDALSRFIDKIVDDGCVICIDAKWGEGKTTFVKWWCDDLRKTHSTVYFDAFKHDFNCEPFSAIMKTLYSQFSGAGKLSEKVINALGKLISETIPSLLAFGAVAGATLAFGPAGAAGATIATAGGKVLGDTIKDFLTKEEIHTLDKTIEEFREALEGITSELYLNGKKKLVFVVDELDRCRPTFAVETIEKVKHLFSVPGIIWILVMNREQLEKSIMHVYGTCDAGRYLNKFIHFYSPLPKSMNDSRYSKLPDHYYMLVNGLMAGVDFKIKTEEELKTNIASLAAIADLSIRETKKMINSIQLIFEKDTDYNSSFLIFAPFITLLKIAFFEMYDEIRAKSKSFQEHIKTSELLQKFANHDEPIKWIPYYLMFALCKDDIEVKSLSTIERAKELVEISGDDFDRFVNQEKDFVKYAYQKIPRICNKLDLVEFE